MTLTTLVSGGSANSREAAIHLAIEQDLLRIGTCLNTALILEGLSDGKLAVLPHALDIKRIAPGCFCCIGNLTLRVTLNRLLRKPPARLYISIADSTHLAQLREFLSNAPYDAFLEMTADLAV
ncbi:MAG: hypothetical protein NVSMB28_22510 [Collimonas sp.]